MHARPFIDSLDFASNGRHISGEVPVAELSRLQDMLENSSGVLKYTVRGNIDKQGHRFLEIEIEGGCSLRCQRCLGVLEYPIRISSCLRLCNQAELDALHDEEAEFDSIPADKQLDVLALLEEEVLLSLPIAPKHPLGACQATNGKAVQKEEDSPFAVLAKFKRS